jgi:hypothetical protein
MTVKEQAEELYTDFYENLWYVDEKDRKLNAKQCASIAASRIIKTLYDDYYDISNGVYEFWEDVEKEIQNM